ncbi:hypothetical protein TNCV_2541931 [Trichonephila clavipes]|nr:hypothetical protein TNCV_2541931 [Trichonephila clavipes]
MVVDQLYTFYRLAVFLVNSQPAILTLCSLRNSNSIEVEEVRKETRVLNSADWTIIFQWIPSLCGIQATLAKSMAIISHSILVACHAACLFQISPDPWENVFTEF